MPSLDAPFNQPPVTVPSALILVTLVVLILGGLALMLTASPDGTVFRRRFARHARA